MNPGDRSWNSACLSGSRNFPEGGKREVGRGMEMFFILAVLSLLRECIELCILSIKVC